ncbi:hypothetical protein BDZ89DRAFT_216347 [Hymenopellis radicata]|nr:hypothetical protein BDZ89DRAFT_216347 [Hymenopellis radicata]
MITLYDLPSTVPGNAWSPSTWIVRYALNIKNIPHKTKWVNYPEIEPACKEIGAAPTGVKPDGSPHYTVPVIHDDSTGSVISESVVILEYLDKRYPDTSTLLPPGTKALHLAFRDAAASHIKPLRQFIITPSYYTMTPPNKAYYDKRFAGISPDSLLPQGAQKVEEWAKAQEALGKIAAWMGPEDKYVMGDEVSYADILTAAFLRWARVSWGEDSQEWKDVMSWHNNRWGRLMAEFAGKYESIKE